MIRLGIIILLIAYCFSLRLELLKKSNSFSHLYDTCNKTSDMVTDLKTMIDSRNKYLGKIALYKKNNDKLLYNYRVCTGALAKTDKSSTLLAKNLFSQ